MKQEEIINWFTKNANYYLVKFSQEGDNTFGKIIDTKELHKLDLSKYEIYRSIKNDDDNTLFVFDLKPKDDLYVDNPLQLLIHNLEDARTIETVYPGIFSWAFDGLSIKAYAIIPSGKAKSQSTISRYGGPMNFIRILRQHLENIIHLRKGDVPNYSFLELKGHIDDMELSLGSLNKMTNLYSIGIDIDDLYIDIIKKSKAIKHTKTHLTVLDMKYWAREINPDFINTAKHFKLKESIPYVEDVYKLYPLPITRLINLKHKGNYNRFLLSRFLLSVHSPKDAKFIFYSVLSPDELNHVKYGNCSTQWNYVLNNTERYSCPSMKELSAFIQDDDPQLSHPLEKIQEYLERKKKDEKDRA